MNKKRSIIFWIFFWIVAGLFLISWYFFWQFKNRGWDAIGPLISVAPISSELKADARAIFAMANYLSEKDDQEKTFLLLFQNDMEIRPGGGFIGSFGVLKLKNGKVISVDAHDTGNFDGRIPSGIKPPYPMQETLKISSWKLRDSNYSPDFMINAEKAEEFYYLGKGEEKFDGVFAITTNVLSALLEITGPVEIEGYPGTYDSENAIIQLEYQVEKGFVDQGIDRGDRKDIMKDLTKAIVSRIDALPFRDKIEIGKTLIDELNRKDIQLYFKDEIVQEKVDEVNWSGKVDQTWSGDYLMISDANLGALKSDYYIKRSIDYSVDISKDQPEAVLKITYNHTAEKEDWMTREYLTYVRIYVPRDAWFESWDNISKPQFGEELGHKYLGTIVTVPIGESKTIELRYKLPQTISEAGLYDLKIQKQSGVNGVPTSVKVKEMEGLENEYQIVINRDFVLSESQK